MKRIIKFAIGSILFCSINSYAEKISNFSELKNKFISGININGVLEIEKCKNTIDPSKTPNSYSRNGYKNLHSRFSSTGGYHQIEEETSTELITFILNQKVLEYQTTNKTAAFFPSFLITEVSVNDKQKVILRYGANIESTHEYTSVFVCDWEALLLNSNE